MSDGQYRSSHQKRVKYTANRQPQNTFMRFLAVRGCSLTLFMCCMHRHGILTADVSKYL